MNIRAQIYGSSKPEEPILRDKQPKGARFDELYSITVARGESRRGNSRAGDRHRLTNETVVVTHDGVSGEAELINLSGGGAMIRGSFEVKLWDSVELRLGGEGTIECAVRWMRGDRIGLEFAHETRLDCSSDELANLLRDVISRSFAEIRFDRRTRPGADRPSSNGDLFCPDEQRAGDENRRAARHPLIWSGRLYLENQSTAVRVRNISSTGAMIECPVEVAVAAEPVLELNDGTAIAATVQWAVGDHVGLRFHREFDIQLLSRSRPEVAPESWNRPGYLATKAAKKDSPWDPRWNRMTMDELSEELEGFLKR